MADGQSEDSLGGVIKCEALPGSLGDLDFIGSVSVRGEQKNLAVGQESRSAIDFSAFTTRDYQFNEAFRDNPTIPHMAPLADIRVWQTDAPVGVDFVWAVDFIKWILETFIL